MKTTFLILLIAALTACSEPVLGQDQLAEDPGVDTTAAESIRFTEVNTERFTEWLGLEAGFELDLAMAGVRRDAAETDRFIEKMEEGLERAESGELSGEEQSEARFLAGNYLAALRMQNYALTENREYAEKALKYRTASIEELQGDERYEIDLAFPKLDAAGLGCYLEPDSSCPERFMELADQYQNLPYGDYPGWFGATMVLPGMKYAVLGSGDEELISEMLSNLEEVAGGNDPMAVSATLLLAEYHLSEGNLDRAESIIAAPPIQEQFMTDDLQVRWNRTLSAIERHSD